MTGDIYRPCSTWVFINLCPAILTMNRLILFDGRLFPPCMSFHSLGVICISVNLVAFVLNSKYRGHYKSTRLYFRFTFLSCDCTKITLWYFMSATLVLVWCPANYFWDLKSFRGQNSFENAAPVFCWSHTSNILDAESFPRWQIRPSSSIFIVQARMTLIWLQHAPSLR